MVLAHAAFVVFVVAGGLLVARRPRLAWLHVPAALWGAFIEFSGGICPLTPLENELRARGGLAAYSGDFVARYVLPVLYPADLTHEIQILLGTIALAVNLVVYWRVIRTRFGATTG